MLVIFEAMSSIRRLFFKLRCVIFVKIIIAFRISESAGGRGGAIATKGKKYDSSLIFVVHLEGPLLEILEVGDFISRSLDLENP